jgi:tetratricopeptide (TPR) repeat protein
MTPNTEEKAKVARRFCENGLWRELLAFAQKWHEEKPADYEALYYLGLGFSGNNQFANAEAAYRRALALNSSDVRVWNNLARLLYENLQRHAEGIGCMKYSLKIDPDHKLGWSNLANMLGRLGQHAKAMAFADQAIALDPKLVEAHLHKGWAALALGKLDVVKEVCHTLASIEPEKFRRAR